MTCSHPPCLLTPVGPAHKSLARALGRGSLGRLEQPPERYLRDWIMGPDCQNRKSSPVPNVATGHALMRFAVVPCPGHVGDDYSRTYGTDIFGDMVPAHSFHAGDVRRGRLAQSL